MEVYYNRQWLHSALGHVSPIRSGPSRVAQTDIHDSRGKITMQRLLKYVVGKTVRPVLESFLSKTRTYGAKDLKLVIPPQVFHPAFFFSTKYLVGYLAKQAQTGKTLLELGAGSGLVSFTSEKRGAIVTATDINKTAIEYLEKNKVANNSGIRIIHSDLFDNIPAEQFDFIVINPPYFKKDPVTELDHAWYCGENGEYFERMFSRIGSYMHENTAALLIASDGADISMVRKFANMAGFDLVLADQKYFLFETNFIFRITPLQEWRKNQNLVPV